MTVGELTTGGWCIEGTDEELSELVNSIETARTEGDHESLLLTDDGVVPVRIELLA